MPVEFYLNLDEPSDYLFDKDLVMRLIDEDSIIFEDISEELQDDKEVVLKAVADEGTLIDWASERLRHDEEVVLAAVKNRPDTLLLVGDSILINDKIIETACYYRNESFKKEVLAKKDFDDNTPTFIITFN